MVLVQLLLRAFCRFGWPRLRLWLVMTPLLALVGAIGAAVSIASVTGVHPLHIVYAAGARLLADLGTLSNGGGPPTP